MCGIAGSASIKGPGERNNRLSQAIEVLRHRGPDDSGACEFNVKGSRVSLCHTRLSIIDLSSDGRQPMESTCGRFVIVFNGEIYNYQELRIELMALGIRFQTQTDTEVLLAAWKQWGEKCLRRLDGMFAFVVCDKAEGKLYCVRDYFGIKPLYYSFRDGEFIFSSEISGLIALAGETPSPNWQQAYNYLVHGTYDNSENTFFSEVFQILPASLLALDIQSIRISEQTRWWNPQIVVESQDSYSDATDTIRALFLRAVRRQMRSDVPIGATLSGGTDSSSIVCAMRHLEPNQPLHTFSYIPSDDRISEKRWIDKVNLKTDANPHLIEISSNSLSINLTDLIRSQGEPFGTTSIYAQYEIFRAVRNAGITVTLDGQGADELLGGYLGYPGERIRSHLDKGQVLDAFRFLANWAKWPDRRIRDALFLTGQLYLSPNLNRLARKVWGRSFIPNWISDEFVEGQHISITEPRYQLSSEGKGRRLSERLRNSLIFRGLPGLLRHADRNSMHFSIENRVPFLTPDFAEYVLSLPEHYLVSNKGETKLIFRTAMEGIVPKDILTRKDKIGLQTPESNWMNRLGTFDRPDRGQYKLPPIFDYTGLSEVSRSRSFSDSMHWRIWNYLKWHEIFYDK